MAAVRHAESVQDRPATDHGPFSPKDLHVSLLVQSPFRALATVVSATLLAAGGIVVAQIDAPRASAAGPSIGCATDSSALNTGYNGAGGRITSGADTQWDVGDGASALSPSSVASWTDATIVSDPAPNWSTSPYNNASWISHSDSGLHTGHHFYYFRYQFVLDSAVKASAFSVSLDFLADNSVREIWINGEAQSDSLPEIPQTITDPEWYLGYIADNAASTTLSDDWKSGQNEIIVLVDTEATNNGFLAQTTSTGYCSDFGDAPQSYGTSRGDGGPSHQQGALSGATAPLTLGSTIDVEGDPTVFDGLADDAAGIDDEDGVAAFAPLSTLTTDYSVSVAVTNGTDDPATVAGWIDFDGDGTFDTEERAVATVAADAASTTLTWAGLTPKNGDTSARFRVYPGVIGDRLPTGEVTGGEVEDYSLSISSSPLQVTKTADKAVAEEGDLITYTITAHNSGTTAATGLSLHDDLADVLTDAVYIEGGADRGTYTYTAPLVSWAGDLGAGETVTITVIVEVHATPAGDRNLVNAVTDRSRQFPTSACSATSTDCVAQVLAGPAFDFGDAPDSYGTARSGSGAVHSLRSYSASDSTTTLMIGELVDSEADAQISDDNAGAADEDGVALPAITDATDQYRVTADVVNSTTNRATLAGWIDFDDDGTFGMDERATATVEPGATIAELVWIDVDVAAGSTEARFRLFAGAVPEPRPTGVATGGEVEDYTVVVASAPAPAGLFSLNGSLASTGSSVGLAPLVGLALLLAGAGAVFLTRGGRHGSHRHQ